MPGSGIQSTCSFVLSPTFLLLIIHSVMSTLCPYLVASAAREWEQLNLVVAVTPNGRKLRHCSYIGDDEGYFNNATWLQVPVTKSLSLSKSPRFVNLLHDKYDTFLSVFIGVINVQDMTFHENTLAVYSGGVAEVVSHLRYTISAPPSIPCLDNPVDKSSNIGVRLQNDFENARRNFTTLQATLPFVSNNQHPFHVLRSIEHGCLTFHHCLTKQPKVISHF